jgi:hypothetical protein
LCQPIPPWASEQTYSCASLAARRFNSSLYLVAALDVYFVFGSLLARAAVPPLDWKNLVADSFPPTFIIRNCSHCHTRTESASPMAFCGMQLTYRQGSWIGQRRCERRDFDGLKSSLNKDRYQKEPKTTLDFSGHNQSISIPSAHARGGGATNVTTHPVGRLGLQLFEKFLRL